MQTMFALRFNTVIQKYVNSAFIIIIITITIVKTINNTIMILINAFV